MNVHASQTLPIKLSERQEQFCQQIVGLKSAAEAYRIAYGAGQKASEANGPRLMGKDRVKARIDQIRAADAAARRVTLPFLTGALMQTAAEARALAQPSAAVAAWMGIAKLHGLLVDRTQIDMLVRRPSASPESPDEMSEEDWLAKHSLAGPSIDLLASTEDQVQKDSIVDSITQGSTSTEHNSDE